MSAFLCLVCEIYVCAECWLEHGSHEGMEEVKEDSEREVEREEMCEKKRESERQERDQREKMENKKLGVLEKNQEESYKDIWKG